MTITWNIEQMDRQTSDGLVTTVHWRANATEIVGTGDAAVTYGATSYGSVGLSAGETIVPFADLTKEMVISWVKDKLGAETVTATESGLTAQIESQKAPVMVSGLPEAWTTITE
jgi:hypothetical protein